MVMGGFEGVGLLVVERFGHLEDVDSIETIITFHLPGILVDKQFVIETQRANDEEIEKSVE